MAMTQPCYFGRQTPLPQAPIINPVHPSTPFDVRNMTEYVSVGYKDSTSRGTWWRRWNTSVWGLKKNVVGGISLERDCGITMLTGLDSSGSSRENERSHGEQIKTALAAAVGEVLFFYNFFFSPYCVNVYYAISLDFDLNRIGIGSVWREFQHCSLGLLLRPQSLIEFAVFSSGTCVREAAWQKEVVSFVGAHKSFLWISWF